MSFIPETPKAGNAMSTVIDFGAIRGGTLRHDPHQYAVVRGSFASAQVARQLHAEFPRDNFSFTERAGDTPGPGKRYRTYNYQLMLDSQRDEARIAALTPLWRRLADEVSGPFYRAALATLTGQDLSGLRQEIRLTRYTPGCWIEPHTDRPDKVVTHLLYFNEPWQEDWLGEFRVLRSADMEDAADRVLPRLGTSVVMVRSENSWHGVPPVQADSAEDRMTMLVHFATAG
jgi:SM-20-related protein